jgi:Bacteriophage Gp15 protein.
MNILTEFLPEAVEIDGETYDLDTDFRTGIDVMMAFEDAELTLQEKAAIMVRLLYKQLPDNIEEACRLAVKFLNCGEKSKECDEGESPDRLYSFDRDARYIYSAIKQSHGVDLESVPYLHWWKFCYMFLDLNKDSFFTQIIDLRRKYLQGKLNKEERELYTSLRDILEMPQYIAPEQLAAKGEFMRLLNGD